MNSGFITDWGVDWAWGLPLIVLTVVFHAYGLGLIDKEVDRNLEGRGRAKNFSAISIYVMGGTALAATILHAIESGLWSFAYLILGALPDRNSAVLYSLNAMTSYGHESIALEPRWKVLGALESLNGWILFGLTTAFLFTVIQRAWRPPNGSPGKK